MKTLTNHDPITENTAAYIQNGHYFHYFQRDAITNELLAIVNRPDDWVIQRIEDGSTYDDLHSSNTITLHANTVPVNTLSLLPNQTEQLLTFFSDRLYTDGHDLLTTKTTTKVVQDPKSFDICPITMTNEITQDDTQRMVGQLHSCYTPTMCATMYRLATKGTPVERSYMRASVKYDKDIKKLTEAGELMFALNDESHESFVTLFDHTLNDNKHTRGRSLNLPGDYFINGSDIQYFIDLSEDTTQLTFRIMTNDESLTLKETITLPLEEAKTLIRTVWYDNTKTPYKTGYQSEAIYSLIDVLHRIVHHKLWEIPTEEIHKTHYLNLWNLSRYYYYD